MTSRTRLITRRLILAGLAASVLAPIAALAADAPKVIRIGLPLVGTGNRPVGGSWNFATVQIKGSLEQEFKADGIRIEWNNFKGAGPALNEAIANKLIDVFAIGDLPGIVGKASGLKTRLVAADNRRAAYAIGVPADSQARGIEDLKGKKVAVFKGTAVQLGFGKFLTRHGLSEKDFKVINMDTNTATEFDAEIATIDHAEFPIQIVDLARLDYLSSAGVRSLFKARKGASDAGGQLLLVNPQPQVRKVFDIIKALPSTSVFESQEEMDRYLDAMQRKSS